MYSLELSFLPCYSIEVMTDRRQVATRQLDRQAASQPDKNLAGRLDGWMGGWMDTYIHMWCFHSVVVITFASHTKGPQFVMEQKHIIWHFPGAASGKGPTCQCRRHKRRSSVPGLGRFPGGVHGNQLQYSCLEDPMDRGYSPQSHKELDTTELTQPGMLQLCG